LHLPEGMSVRPLRPRGFTLLEVLTVVAIIGVLAALAVAVPRWGRERATLSNIGVELQALIHQARQTALSESEDVAVVFFPTFANPAGGVGRVVVYRDQNGNFFGAGVPSLQSYDPALPGFEAGDAVLEVWDLPRQVELGTVTAAALPAPYNTIPAATACSFCAGGRGAIRFDSRGRARFYGTVGPPAQVTGGSVSLAVPAISGQRPLADGLTIAVHAATGSVRTFPRR